MTAAVITSFLQLLDNSGNVLNGGTVTVQDAGTTTPRAIYTDTGLSSSATNPIPLNSAGRHTQGIVYLSPANYKIIVKNSAGTTLYTLDNIDPGVPVGSGALPIANGGTAGTTAAAARTNLGAASSSEVSDIASDVADLQASLTGTGATQLASGTTAQRPVSPVAGMARWNSTTSRFEAYDGSNWYNVVTSEERASTAAITAETDEATFISPNRLPYSKGVVQAWGYVTVSGGTPTLAAGYNISSTITDNGTGDFTHTFTNALGDANYALVAMVYSSGFLLAWGKNTTPKSTTTFRIQITDRNGTDQDPAAYSFIIIGNHA